MSSSGELDQELVSKWADGFKSVPHHDFLVDNAFRYGIDALSIDPTAARKHDHVFSNIIPVEGKATSQKSSGRCWIFAALNVFRIPLIAKMGLPETFEFSQNYIFFCDKLEKCNYFLETIIATIDTEAEGPRGRLWSHMLKAPIIDGGQWDMFTNVIRKHGMVPKSVYPDTHDATNSKNLNWLINNKLRENTSYFWQHYIANRDTVSIDEIKSQLRTRKLDVLCQIHKTISFYLGPLPTTFSWSPVDNKAHTHVKNPFKDVIFTPQKFLEDVVFKYGLDTGKDSYEILNLRKKGKKLATFLANQTKPTSRQRSMTPSNDSDVEKEMKQPEAETESDIDATTDVDVEAEAEAEAETETRFDKKSPDTGHYNGSSKDRDAEIDDEAEKKHKNQTSTSSKKCTDEMTRKKSDNVSIWGDCKWLQGLSVSAPTTWISFINDPRNEYNRSYTVQHLGSVWGGRKIIYINVDQPTLQTLTHTSIGGLVSPTWFGCDSGKFIDRAKGFWDYNVFKYSRTLQTNIGAVNSDGNTDIDNTKHYYNAATTVATTSQDNTFVFDKKQRLYFGESLMTHAMVFTGVDVDRTTKDITRYRVENSWGTERADCGYYSITKEWFDEFVYQVVLPREHVPPSLNIDVEEILRQEPIELPLWDPMGALAK